MTTLGPVQADTCTLLGAGKDVVLRLPRGTQVFAEDNETLLVDMTEIGQRVSALLEATLKDADTRARVIKAGMVPEFSTAAEFKAKIDFETKAYGEQMRMFNIKIDQQ